MQIPFETFGGSGPILHFAHANGFPPAGFKRFLNHFTDEYKVTGMAQRPLWPETKPEDLSSWKVLADDLITCFDQNGWRDVIGVGVSMGAVSTMYAALKRPDLFKKLIFIEPVFLTPITILIANLTPYPWRRSVPMIKTALNRRDRWENKEVVFEQYRQKRIFKRYPDDVLQDYVNSAIIELDDGSGEVGLAYPKEWEARIYMLPPKVWREVPKITHPTLGVRGKASPIFFESEWARWQRLQPGADFVEIEDAGHMIPLEQPDALAQAIKDWLQK